MALREPVIEVRRGGGVERIELERATRTGSSSRTWAGDPGEAEPLLGRGDAMGQARALEALHRSAQSGAPVAL